MVKSSTKTLVSQTQNMFPDGNTQSEILNIAQEHEFLLQRLIDSDGKELYAVQDWIAGVAKTSDMQVAKNILQMIKRRATSVTKTLVKLPYLATNGRTYQMDFADGETLYLITQQMDTQTGIRNEVLTHLAKTGAFVDAARRDPESAELALNQHSRRKAEYEGKDETWILTREIGKVTRKQFVALLLKVSPSANVGIATNIGYQGTLGMNAKGLNVALGQKTGDNPRDGMSRLALAYTLVHEESATLRLNSFGEDEILPSEIVYRELKQVSDTVGIQAREMAKQLGVDIVTGQKRLGGGK